MSDEEFTNAARRTCGRCTESCDSELVYCTHKDNKNENEGNCTKQDCPIMDHVKELFEAHNILQKGDEMNKISMDKTYKYRNGEPARILCVDGGNKNLPVVSIQLDGKIHNHTIDGLLFSTVKENSDYDLIEVWKPTRDEWCLFTNDNKTYILRKFHSIINEFYADSYGSSWEYCYQFDGTLPDDVKD